MINLTFALGAIVLMSIATLVGARLSGTATTAAEEHAVDAPAAQEA